MRWFSRSPARARRQPNRSYCVRPEVEVLEDRSLPASPATLNAGTLLIWGTNVDDSISISEARVVVGSVRGPFGNVVGQLEDVVRVTVITWNNSTSSSGVLNQTFSFRKSDVRSIRVLAGDGNDSVTNNTGIASEIDGGEGNDILRGGAGNDVIVGGRGADQLFGNDGSDKLDGGRDGFRDVVDGGAGYDSAVRRDHSVYVNVEKIEEPLSRQPPIDEPSVPPDPPLPPDRPPPPFG